MTHCGAMCVFIILFCVKIVKLRMGAILAFVVFLLSMFPSLCFPHPHVFIENTLTIVFDRQGLEGILVKWIFDEFFSSMITGEFDSNHNGELEDTEIRTIKEKAFVNLANFEYFTFIKIEKKIFNVKYVRNFSAALAGGKLIYEFYIPCHVKATPAFKEFTITQYDPTYYTSVAFAKDNPVRLDSDSDFEVSYRIAKNTKKAYYFGQVNPVEVILKFCRKND